MFCVLAAAAAMMLTACSSRDTAERPLEPPTIAASPTAGAGRQLAAAVRQLSGTTFTMRLNVGLPDGTGTLSGRVDPVRKIGEFTATTSGADKATSTQWRIIGTTGYATTLINGRPANSTKPWRRLIEDRRTGAGMATAFDGAHMALPLATATHVTRTGEHRYTGLVDHTAASNAIGLQASTTTPRPTPGSSNGPATTTPFTADLDDQGRLTSYRLTLTTSTGRHSQISLAYSDFGIPVSVEAPPDNLINTASIR